MTKKQTKSSCFDSIDLKIMTILQKNATVSKAEISRAVGVAPSAIFPRLKKLEKNGVIKAYETRLDPDKLGYHTLAFLFVSETRPVTRARTAERLANVTGVEEVHKIAGDDSFLVKIRARSAKELVAILDDEVNSISTIARTRTMIVLDTVKEDVVLGGIERSQL